MINSNGMNSIEFVAMENLMNNELDKKDIENQRNEKGRRKLTKTNLVLGIGVLAFALLDLYGHYQHDKAKAIYEKKIDDLIKINEERSVLFRECMDRLQQFESNCSYSSE